MERRERAAVLTTLSAPRRAQRRIEDRIEVARGRNGVDLAGHSRRVGWPPNACSNASLGIW